MKLQRAKKHLSLSSLLLRVIFPPSIKDKRERLEQTIKKIEKKKNDFKKESIGNGPIRRREGERGLRKGSGQTKRWNSSFDRCCILFSRLRYEKKQKI
ncbi:hypothetical protein CDAR_603661 [Caerostris darwini]|uniref:Uncharacterized protein n=1 Tax=Caerostris darwini TaxID=1538125 RepID=A0AAV4T756_9ARAC|nr:hypothetical protein CDAR_603661 [Caerostris darwini]